MAARSQKGVVKKRLDQSLSQEAQRLRSEIEQQEKVMARGDGEVVTDSADQAEEMEERNQCSALVDELQTLLSQVEEARRRLAAGGYGLCADCGRPIPPERLQVLPMATRCVPCQSRHDRMFAR